MTAWEDRPGLADARVSNGIYLVHDGSERLVIMFLPNQMGPHAEVNLQIAGTSQGRGGNTTPLNFLTRPNVSRDQIVLPGALPDEIERQVIGVAKQANRLLASGQHLKRGIQDHLAPHDLGR